MYGVYSLYTLKVNTVGLFSRSAPILGVDVNNTNVRFVLLSKSGSRVKLENFGMQKLPSHAVVNRAITDIDAVGDCIKQLLKRKKVKGIKNAAIAVSGSSVITKIIQMDQDLSDHDIEMQIQVEADQYIPFALF